MTVEEFIANFNFEGSPDEPNALFPINGDYEIIVDQGSRFEILSVEYDHFDKKVHLNISNTEL